MDWIRRLVERRRMEEALAMLQYGRRYGSTAHLRSASA